jgi:hypothetical protein
MAGKWEAGLCTTQGANQGKPTCIVDLQQLSFMVAIPKGTVITQTDLADFSAYLATKSQDPDPNKRFYLLGEFVSFEDANTAPTTETASNQQTRTVNQGATGYNLTQWAGGLCGYKNLLKMHQTQDRFDFLQVHGNIIVGVLTTDSAGLAAMRGISMVQVFTRTITMPTGAAGSAYVIEFRVGDSKQLRELLTYTQMADGFDIQGVMKGITDVQLSGQMIAGGTAGDYLVSAITTCGGVSLSTIYAVELASPTAWKSFNPVTGALLTITTVAAQGDNFKFTYDTADLDYPVAPGSLALELTDLVALKALGVIGYESNTAMIPVG